MRRTFYHFAHWEDHRNGLYSLTPIFDEAIVSQAAELLRAPDDLFMAMALVVDEWPYAAAVNLSNPSRNRQAWLGQAACCFVHGTPEHLTKLAWHRLTDDEQSKANASADTVLGEWDRGGQLVLFGEVQCQNDI